MKPHSQGWGFLFEQGSYRWISTDFGLYLFEFPKLMSSTFAYQNTSYASYSGMFRANWGEGNLEGYRYGFGGMEMENDLFNNGNSYTTFHRPYDARLGRWLRVDPLFQVLPSHTPYSYANNMPIIGNDTEGDICLPCIAVVIGLLTMPQIAVAPTGNPNDKIAIKKAEEMQAKWLLCSVMSGGVASRQLTQKFFKQLFNQYSTYVILYSIKEARLASDDYKVDMWNDVLLKSFKNLDFFDAVISISELNKISQIILAASVDLTPDELNYLGIKDPGEITVDLVLGVVSGMTEGKIAKGRYGNILKGILGKTDEAVQQGLNEGLKEVLSHEEYTEFKDMLYNDIMGDRLEAEMEKVSGKDNLRPTIKVD